jgi:DNA-binding transcriptional ArsR family regulator
MNTTPDLAAVAALIGDPSRAAMLSALLGGHALPAGELARHARVSAQTASAHLTRLVAAGILTVTPSGRHRYYALNGKEVARALESLALIAPAQRPRSLARSLEAEALCHARTCYDHLAGTLGVALAQGLIARGLVERHQDAFAVTAAGAEWLALRGVYPADLARSRRLFAPVCIDWSERKPHIAGALGAALARYMVENRFIARNGKTRAVRITEAGYAMLEQELRVTLRQPADASPYRYSPTPKVEKNHSEDVTHSPSRIVKSSEPRIGSTHPPKRLGKTRTKTLATKTP